MENKIHPAATSGEKKGGYPAGTKPVSQIKPPPPAVSKPKSAAKP
jgi:hypothetical protein